MFEVTFFYSVTNGMTSFYQCATLKQKMNRILSIESQIISSPQKEGQTFSSYKRSSTIDPISVIKFVYGPNYEHRLRILKLIEDNPKEFEHLHLTEATRDHKRAHSGHSIFWVKDQLRKFYTYEQYLEDPNKLSLISSAIVTYDAALSIKNGVHWFLYMKTVFNLGTKKHEPFIKRAVDYSDVGCFGLTELLHGSNVRGVLTEAHYDHGTRSFIVNSPSKDAMKFWIGAAANLANISVIWAQLYIKDKCYGVHAFIVPLRDKKTHKLLPGVLVGDCGPKNGCNLIDNGFIMLDHVRIPVDNLLDRISQIDEKGEFKSIVQSEDQRFGLQLGSLSGGRYMVAMNGTVMAMEALTIALRYACVRRQFSSSPNTKEALLLEYPLMKRRLLPLLAQSIVYMAGNMSAVFKWDANYKEILNPKNRVVQELHAISSATKPKSGWFATEVIKECRQCMGGHGYNSASKMGTLFSDHDINNTWEGDNTVLLQQATKFVLDKFVKVMKGKEVKAPILEFLKDAPEFDEQFRVSTCPQQFKKFLQAKIYKKLQDFGMRLQQLSKGMTQFEAWNASQVFLGKEIALTFGDLFYLEAFENNLLQIQCPKSAEVMKHVLSLWVLRCYRYDEMIGEGSHAEIEQAMMEHCEKIAPEALGLVEAICASDKVIGSPFADSNGHGFEKYVQHFMGSEQNKPQNLKPAWWQHLVDRKL